MRALRLAVLLAGAGCAAAPPAPAPPPVPAEPPNLEVAIQEVVSGPEQDGMAYARVFVGGKEAGRTEPSRRSELKTWAARLEPGNHPLRVEYWVLPDVGEWRRAAEQPHERFVRVEPGKLTRLRVRFPGPGRRPELSVEKLPLQ